MTNDDRPMNEIDPVTKSRRGWWIVGAVALIGGAAVFGVIAASGGNGNEAGETTAALNTTGDDRFARAAGVLRGKRAGRGEIDDTAALAMARRLLETGAASTKSDACSLKYT